MRMQKTVTRYFPERGTRRRNGLVIVDPRTGQELRIRIHRGRDATNLRVSISAADEFVAYAEEDVAAVAVPFSQVENS